MLPPIAPVAATPRVRLAIVNASSLETVENFARSVVVTAHWPRLCREESVARKLPTHRPDMPVCVVAEETRHEDDGHLGRGCWTAAFHTCVRSSSSSLFCSLLSFFWLRSVFCACDEIVTRRPQSTCASLSEPHFSQRAFRKHAFFTLIIPALHRIHRLRLAPAVPRPVVLVRLSPPPCTSRCADDSTTSDDPPPLSPDLLAHPAPPSVSSLPAAPLRAAHERVSVAQRSWAAHRRRRRCRRCIEGRPHGWKKQLRRRSARVVAMEAPSARARASQAGVDNPQCPGEGKLPLAQERAETQSEANRQWKAK